MRPEEPPLIEDMQRSHLSLKTTFVQFSLRNADSYTASVDVGQKAKPSTLALAAITLIT